MKNRRFMDEARIYIDLNERVYEDNQPKSDIIDQSNEVHLRIGRG